MAVRTLTSDGIERLVETFQSEPPDSFSILLQHSGGTIGRIPVDATAFPNRDANYWLMLSKRWTDPAEDASHLSCLLVVPAGSRVRGTVTSVVSGSRAIGAVPELGLRFEQLDLGDGRAALRVGNIDYQTNVTGA